MPTPATLAHRLERHPAFAPWRRLLVAALALALLAIGLAAHDPEVHEHVHHDEAHDTDHACAITLAATGFCDTTAPAPAPGPVANALIHARLEPGSFEWTTPDFWLIPTHAPPARAC